MNKILSKSQLKVIMLLNAVIIVMFIGVLVAFGSRQSGADADAVIPPHKLIRSARLSANADISWETNIGGSGSDELVASFTAYNRVYIFGNTLSADYDFAGAKGGGFCAILTLSGNTKSFSVYPFNITRVLPTLDGFAAAGNQGSSAMLKLINSDGVVVGGVTQNPSIKQTAEDLYINGSNYYLVTSCYDNVLEKNTIFVNSYSMALVHKFEYAISCAFDLQYINILPYKQSLMLCANVVSAKDNYLAMILFDKLNVPVFKFIKSDYDYFCYNVAPYDNGYTALANKNNRPEIITITSDFKKDLTKNLQADSAQGCGLFFSSDFYYSFVCDSGVGSLQKMNTSLSTVEKISESSDFNFIDDSAYNDKAICFLGKTDKKLKILALANSGSVMQKQIATANESGGKIIPLDDGFLIIANSSAKSDDVGGNFGGNDIWIAKINF